MRQPPGFPRGFVVSGASSSDTTALSTFDATRNETIPGRVSRQTVGEELANRRTLARLVDRRGIAGLEQQFVRPAAGLGVGAEEGSHVGLECAGELDQDRPLPAGRPACQSANFRPPVAGRVVAATILIHKDLWQANRAACQPATVSREGEPCSGAAGLSAWGSFCRLRDGSNANDTRGGSRRNERQSEVSLVQPLNGLHCACEFYTHVFVLVSPSHPDR